MSRQENPYAPPLEHDSAEPSPGGELTKPQRKRLEVGEVVVAWEKRRVWYNLALTAVVLLSGIATLPELLSRLFMWSDVAELIAALGLLAVGANTCYLAGPLVEGYATWFFGRSRWLRDTLYVVGTAFAVLLTSVICGSVVYAIKFG